jgi:hypothetical protein
MRGDYSFNVDIGGIVDHHYLHFSDGRRPYKRRKISSEYDSSSKYTTDIATSPTSYGSGTVKPSPTKRSKSSTNGVTSTQNMTELISVVLPDSTSKTYDDDDTAKVQHISVIVYKKYSFLQRKIA